MHTPEKVYMSEAKQMRSRDTKVGRAIKLLKEVLSELEIEHKKEHRLIKKSNYELLPSLDNALEAVIIEDALGELGKQKRTGLRPIKTEPFSSSPPTLTPTPEPRSSHRYTPLTDSRGGGLRYRTQ